MMKLNLIGEEESSKSELKNTNNYGLMNINQKASLKLYFTKELPRPV